MKTIIYGGRFAVLRDRVRPDHVVAAASLSDHLFGLADAAVAGFFAVAATVAGVMAKDWLKNRYGESDEDEVDDVDEVETARRRHGARGNGYRVRNRRQR